MTTYAGKDNGVAKYDKWNIICAMPPTNRWKRVAVPQAGRSIQIRGNVVLEFVLTNHF
jgi:hypothetical protein